MHYHYFTIEQRETLSREIHRLMGEAPEGAGLAPALARLRSPDYGICERCQADIAFVRLLKDPLARRCRDCEGED